ncbi:hypothetical protein ACIOUE_15315 [Streptomyces xanthochromogenes]|uniref:hypothetical protein n=1 Tax=Streptomyces xanthochromogenes TaxID=67384 RepID=UPI003809E856
MATTLHQHVPWQPWRYTAEVIPCGGSRCRFRSPPSDRDIGSVAMGSGSGDCPR